METKPCKKRCTTEADPEAPIASAEPCDPTFVFGEPAEPVMDAVAALEGTNALAKAPWTAFVNDAAPRGSSKKRSSGK